MPFTNTTGTNNAIILLSHSFSSLLPFNLHRTLSHILLPPTPQLHLGIATPEPLGHCACLFYHAKTLGMSKLHTLLCKAKLCYNFFVCYMYDIDTKMILSCDFLFDRCVEVIASGQQCSRCLKESFYSDHWSLCNVRVTLHSQCVYLFLALENVIVCMCVLFKFF